VAQTEKQNEQILIRKIRKTTKKQKKERKTLYYDNLLSIMKYSITANNINTM